MLMQYCQYISPLMIYLFKDFDLSFSNEALCLAGEEACSFRGTHRLELMKHEIDHNVLSHSRNGPKKLWPSISNYVLQVSSSDDTKSPAVYLYFLDSGGGSYPEVISSAQAEWFQHKSQEINPDSRYKNSEIQLFFELPFIATY